MSIDLTQMPKLGFGLMRLPEKDGAIDHEQLCSMVDAYMQSGMNYFDTAYMYCDGRSETAIREALVKRYPRDAFMLTDKLPQWMMNGIDDRDRILNDQLERTGAGYFDIYLLHSVEDGANYEGYVKYDCFNWLKGIKLSGKARHIGFSYHGTPELLDRILSEHPEIEIVQIQLNYADWENPLVQSEKLYNVLRKHALPILVMEPVKGGTLADVSPDIEKLFRAARPDASAASWALRFVGSLDGVVTILSGMSAREQMQDNLRTFTSFEPLSQSEKELIAQARHIMLSSPTVPCTACRYCCDGCPQSIAIPDVFKALNTVRLYGEQDMRPRFFYNGLVEHSGRAGDCLACRQCESVCPQHLPIIELLREASAKLDVAETN